MRSVGMRCVGSAAAATAAAAARAGRGVRRRAFVCVCVCASKLLACYVLLAVLYGIVL